MRVPWKIIRVKGIWMLISMIGIWSFFSNMLSFSSSYNYEKSLSNYQTKPRHFTVFAEHGLWKNGSLLPAHPESGTGEVQHIAFLKVHKAASSTAQNIFLRFGWKRNLTFVLAPAKNPAGYPNIISLRESLTNSNILPPPPGKHYDILCNHVFYTNKAFKAFMPEDTIFIGIVREPFELYKSILNYFRPRYIFSKIKGDHPASVFLRDPEKYEPKGRISSSWTNNRMAIEYGFPEEVFRDYNKSVVDRYIQKLDSEFQIVLVSEFMDESVIIMRRYLKWQTRDILFLDQNVARKKNETNLSKAFDRDFYKDYAKIDYDLYNFFYKRLKNQIRREGADFDDELLEFRELRKRTKEYCLQREVFTPIVVQRTRWGDEFTVSKQDCLNMWRGEIDFITRIRVRQYGSTTI